MNFDVNNLKWVREPKQYTIQSEKTEITTMPGTDLWQRYIGSIISFKEFFMAQGEKGRRSNIDENTNQRKATRYSSQSVLSGLLVCGECGRNCRRIARPSGEAVRRCANRVECGKRFCKRSGSDGFRKRGWSAPLRGSGFF